MNQQEILQIIQAILGAETNEELTGIINDNMEILSEDSIAQVQEWSQIALENGDREESIYWASIVERLSDYHAQFLAQSDGEHSIESIPTPDTPETRWAKLFRQYIAFQEKELLVQAIEAANLASDHRVVNILKAFDSGSIQETIETASPLHHSLLEKGHSEEAWTVALGELCLRASYTENFNQAPLEHQQSYLEFGIHAAHEAALISQSLGDESCIAFFITVAGIGLKNANRLKESESAFRAALEIRERLSEARPEIFEADVATTLNRLGNVLSELWKLEESESAFRAALEIRERLAQARPEIFEADVATTHNSLGNVLSQLHKLSEAKSAYRAALETYQRLAQARPEVFEADVAMTLNNLGNVLRDLRRLEESESTYRAALEIRERLSEERPKVFEADVAMTLNNLGNVLSNLRRLEESESTYRVALEIRERLSQARPEVFEQYVAMTHNSLGNVLRQSHRLEESESAFRAALETYQRLSKARPEVFDQYVAAAQTNLGNVLSELWKLEESESAFRAALEIRKRLAQARPEIFEQYVATTLSSLGNVLRNLRRLEESESAYRAALEICEQLAESRPEVFDEYVATTHNNLGNVLRDLRRFEESESAYRAALEICEQLAESRPEVFDEYVATTHNNLGAISLDLNRLEESESAFRVALEIFQSRNSNHQKVKTLNNLTRLLIMREDWQEAIDLSTEAVSLVEKMRGEVLSLNRQRQILSENFEIYENLLVCLMKLRRYDEALVVAEQGKSRTLIDLMASKDVEPRNTSPELVREYKRVLQQVRGLQQEENSSGADSEDKKQRLTLEASYRRYDELVKQIRLTDPDFLPHAQTLNHQQILNVARDAQATLVIFRVTKNGTFVFLVFPDGETDTVEIAEFTTDVLNDLIAHFEDDKAISGWLVDYYNFQVSQAQKRQDGKALSNWKATMSSTLEKLHTLLMAPIQERLRGSTSLVFIPNRALAILPLHACWWNVTVNGKAQKRYWLDEYKIRYAPSLFILRRSLQQEAKLRATSEYDLPDTLFGVVNPQSNLEFSMWEGQELERLLGKEQCLMLWEKNATRDALERELRGQFFIHFSCHANYDMTDPLSSALGLAEGTVLTLGDIFEKLNIPSAWLVVLSACETSLTDWRAATDEHYGLATGFLYAGVPTVFASLWAVDDGSTALMMTHAYQGLQKSRDKAEVLRQTQIWLRTQTAEQLLAVLPNAPYTQKMRENLSWMPSDVRPFEHPIWWAAFQSVGA